MAESEGAFRLTFVQGRGLLSLSDRDFEGLGHVDALELEIPDLRFPFDLSGGVARFKNRRLHLRELSLFVGAKELATLLARAPLGDFGIFNPRVAIEGTRLTLCGRVVLGGHEAELTAVAALAPAPPRSASLCVYGVRAYGFLPIPAPLVVMALFTALGAESPANRDRAGELGVAPLIHFFHAADIRIDVCDLAMLAILPMHGWRLPERSRVQIRVAGGAALATRIPLVFAHSEPDAPSDPLLGEEAIPAVLAMRDFAERAAPIEEALARGDVASALAQLRTRAPVEADDKAGTRRLLQLLVAAQDTLPEAGEVAQAALAKWPDFAPAVLALAVLASERNQPEEAAGLYQRLAELSAMQGRGEDESCALLAGARQSLRAGQQERALATLERALLYRASLRPLARARIMKRVVSEGWDAILSVIGEEACAEQPDVGDEVAQVLELVHQGNVARDSGLVGQAADALEALLARGEWPESSLSRAEVAYHMGLVRLSLGDDEAASRWFGACIEGDASGPVAAAAWHALADLLHRRGDAAQEAQALLGWAGDARVPESAADKVKHLLDAAAIAEGTLGEAGNAASYLEMALVVSPADAGVLDALERLAGRTGDAVTVADILRRHLRESRPDQGKAILRLLIRLLAEHEERADEAKVACAVLLELDPDDDEATFFQARLAWQSGDRAGAAAGYLRATGATGLASHRRAEAHLRTAELMWGEGRREEAQAQLAQGLAYEPEGAPGEVLVEALHAVGADDELAALLAQRERAAGDAPSRIQSQRWLAEAAEHSGDLGRAEATYRALHEADPSNPEWLQRLVALARRQANAEALGRWLEKLWGVLEGAGLSAAGPVDVVAVGLELADLLASDPAGTERAEAILRRLADLGPLPAHALDLRYGLLLDHGGFAEAAKVFAERLAQTPADEVPAFVLSRVRGCLAKPDGLRPALALLQSFAIEALGEEAVNLRIELAERAGDALDAVHGLESLRERAPVSERAASTRRLVDLVSRPSSAPALSIAVLERLQAEAPDDLAVAEALFEAYGRMDDREARNRAWQALLAKVPGLPDDCRARLQIALSEAAERDGDLQGAEAMLETATRLAASGPSRAERLVVHARLLAARGELERAQADLDEALSARPDSASALALAGDLAYRAQDWERARKAYARLADLPDATAVLSPKLLAFRRAELAEMFGDHAEAEGAYRQVVAVDPHDDLAREALGGFCLARGDWSEAALHLQELVRLLPKESVDRLAQARQHLGQVYLGLGDLQAARQHLELALASHPDRPSTLEFLATTYERIGLFREAVAMCERLSRVLADPAKKAEALFRKGEVLRADLGDEESATEAYLRASDLDPSFAPNLARLVEYDWSRGDLSSLVDVGVDLVHAGPVPKCDREDVGLLVAIAALLTRGDEGLAKAALESPLLGGPVRADLAALRLGQLVGRVARGEIGSLDRVLEFVCSTIRGGFESELRGAVLRAVAADPGDGAQCMLLGRLFERRGQAALARSAYGVAQFLDGSLGAGRPLADLGDETKPRLEAFFPGSNAVHPWARGPLRKVLQHLAIALVSPGGGAGPGAELVDVEPLQPATVVLCETLQRDLSAPAIPFVAHGEGADVTLSATQPLRILIGRRAETLPAEDLRFFVARALEQARAGTLALLRMSQENLQGMLMAVSRIAGTSGAPFDIAGQSADEGTALWLERLRAPQTAALIPLERIRGELLDHARQALASPPEIETYLRGCRYTADRVGLLASGKPLAVLRALAGSLKDAPTADAATVAERQELMRNSQALRELVVFMLSEEYSALVVGA